MKPEAVFKAYDIRGRTDTGEIDTELYYRIGASLIDVLGTNKLAVGRDCRPTSPDLSDALVDGATAAGAHVVDLGEIPTEVLYYYSGSQQIPGAVVTASHNPAQYNGLKICREGAVPVGIETGLAEIQEKVADFLPPVADQGSVIAFDPIPGYLEHLFRIVDPGSIGPLRIAVDGGNGMAGVVLGRVFEGLEASLEGLYLEPDGTFPNHPADPLQPENLADLIQLVGDGDFDLGVAFDGDADRAFFLDETGATISGSTITTLVAKAVLENSPGASIVHNLITSRAVPEIILENGGKPVRTRVGHSYIKAVMAETDSLFGGEHSGHYYFADNYRADSGILAMLHVLSVLTDAGIPMSELRDQVERYDSSGEVNFEVMDQDSAISRLEEEFGEFLTDRLDGLTFDLGDSWFNVRASNTEPLLRLNVEGTSREAVDSAVRRIATIIRAQS